MEEEEDEEEALYQRGLSHLLGTDGVEASVLLALECFARPAERGHAAAQYSLASCYLTADPAAVHAYCCPPASRPRLPRLSPPISTTRGRTRRGRAWRGASPQTRYRNRAPRWPTR